MATEQHSTKKASAAGGFAIPLLGWVLSVAGIAIPSWLAWPAGILCVILLGYAGIGFARVGIAWAKRHRIKMLPLAVTAILFVCFVSSAVWLAFDRGFIAAEDFQKESTELSGLSNAQLRVKAFEAAKALRQKEAGRPAMPTRPYEPSTTTHEQRYALWAAYIEETSKLLDDYKNDFLLNYRSELLVLRKELRIRLKKAGGYESDQQYYIGSASISDRGRNLDDATLYGMKPLGEMADMFEGMARALP